MKQGRRGKPGPPQIPEGAAAFSGRYRIRSRQSWERFVAELAGVDQAFQLILQASDEVEARAKANALVKAQVVPYVQRAASNLRLWFDCDSPLGMPVGEGFYSVTFVAAVQRKIPNSK